MREQGGGPAASPAETGRRYDRIAGWWQGAVGAGYGVPQVERAVGYCARRGLALDAGCGAGGRIVEVLAAAGFGVVGLDVSYGMLRLARWRHPRMLLVQADLATLAAARRFDLVVAWDSSFHLPADAQARAVESLCALLAPAGVLLFTAGGTRGDTTGTMHGESFHYGSLDVAEYAEVLRNAGCRLLDVEHDQPPADHVCVIARRIGPSD